MTVPNIVTVMGSGVALALSGVLLVGGALAVGLSAAVEAIPLWASLLVVGAVLVAVGVALLMRGEQKTQQKVDKELSPAGLVKNFPVATMATVAVGTLILYRLLQGRRRIKVVQSPTAAAEPVYVRSPGAYGPAPPPPPEKSWLQFVAEQLAPVATAAATTAAGFAMKSMNLPDPARLLTDVLGLDKYQDKPGDGERAKYGDEPARRDPYQHAGNGLHADRRF